MGLVFLLWREVGAFLGYVTQFTWAVTPQCELTCFVMAMAYHTSKNKSFANQQKQG